MSLRLRQPIVLLAMMALSACNGPTAPPPPPDAPTLTCPASVSVVSLDGAAVPISFAVPTPVGGQSPIVVGCSRLSGSAFPPGSTIVSCTVTDGLQRSATCNFNVTVTVPPRISKTKFLAFGDSITYGRCGPKPGECPPYTFRLAELLRARYTNQTIVVSTSGVPGEKATEGEDRLVGELLTYRPEVLLLMEGTNDMTATFPDGPEAIESLGEMIDFARVNGVTAIFLATLPPIAPGGPNAGAIPLVPSFNIRVRNLAAEKRVTLVDVYAALNADVPRYYVGDDLHPTGEGLRLIGETFYTSIRETLDITPTGGGLASQSPWSSHLFESPAQKRKR